MYAVLSSSKFYFAAENTNFMIRLTFIVLCFFATNYGVLAQHLVEEIYGEGLGFTEGYDVINTDDEGFLLIGSKTIGTNENFTDPWCIKIDNKGNVFWEFQPVFGLNSIYDIAYSGIETEEGFVILGNHDDPATFTNLSYLFAVDKEGNELWRKELLEYPSANYGKIIEVEDGFVIGGAFDRSFGDWVYSLVKFNVEGNEVWFQEYDEVSSGGLFFTISLAKDSQGNIILGGDSQGRTCIIKTDSAGELLWIQHLDVQGPSLAHAITSTDEIVSLSSTTYSSNPSINTISHLSADGEIKSILEIDYGFIESPTDAVLSLANELIIAGSNLFPTEPTVIKLDLTGDTLWSTVIDVPEGLVGVALEEVEITAFNNIAVAGIGFVNSSIGPVSGYIYFGILNGEGVITSEEFIPIQDRVLTIYPNPSSDFLFVNTDQWLDRGAYLMIHKLDGKLMIKEEVKQEKEMVSLTSLAAGKYLVSLIDAQHQTISKQVFIKL